MRIFWVSLLLGLLLTPGDFLAGRQRRDKKYEAPKPQVIPLPRELPMVLSAKNRGSNVLQHTTSDERRPGGPDPAKLVRPAA